MPKTHCQSIRTERQRGCKLVNTSWNKLPHCLISIIYMFFGLWKKEGTPIIFTQFCAHFEHYASGPGVGGTKGREGKTSLTKKEKKNTSVYLIVLSENGSCQFKWSPSEWKIIRRFKCLVLHLTFKMVLVQDAGRKVIWQVLLTWLENLKHNAVHWAVSGLRADISELLQLDDIILVGHESSIKRLVSGTVSWLLGT